MIPFYSVLFGFFISTESSYSWTTYFEPFLYESWIVLSGLLIVIALSLALVAKVGNDKCINEFTLEKCFVFVFGAFGSFSIRRWSVTPVNISTRTIFITVLTCGSLVHWHWKASIISYLSVVDHSIPFNSL